MKLSPNQKVGFLFISALIVVGLIVWFTATARFEKALQQQKKEAFRQGYISSDMRGLPRIALGKLGQQLCKIGKVVK